MPKNAVYVGSLLEFGTELLSKNNKVLLNTFKLFFKCMHLADF